MMPGKLSDYHIHPNYSIDAAPVKIKEYCTKALEMGLKEICFTTHLELGPDSRGKDDRVNFQGEVVDVRDRRWLEGYLQEIEEARSFFQSQGLQVKAGMEVGYIPGLEKEIESFIAPYPFDYVLGAVHIIDGFSVASKKESPQYFRTRSLKQVAREYFGILEEAVKSGLFDCMAHLDIYTRYGSQIFGEKIYTLHEGYLEPILEEMARRGMGLEINTSSCRRGLKEFHPSRKLVALAAQKGIKIFTIGSDAHRLEELGDHLDEALEVLAELNLQNHGYTRRQAYPLTP